MVRINLRLQMASLVTLIVLAMAGAMACNSPPDEIPADMSAWADYSPTVTPEPTRKPISSIEPWPTPTPRPVDRPWPTLVPKSWEVDPPRYVGVKHWCFADGVDGKHGPECAKLEADFEDGDYRFDGRLNGLRGRDFIRECEDGRRMGSYERPGFVFTNVGLPNIPDVYSGPVWLKAADGRSVLSTYPAEVLGRIFDEIALAPPSVHRWNFWCLQAPRELDLLIHVAHGNALQCTEFFVLNGTCLLAKPYGRPFTLEANTRALVVVATEVFASKDRGYSQSDVLKGMVFAECASGKQTCANGKVASYSFLGDEFHRGP